MTSILNTLAQVVVAVLGDANPASKSATYTSTGFDLQGYEGEIVVTQHIGAVGGTSPTWDGKIQDSADNSSFADVTGATLTQVTASNNVQGLKLDARNLRRYIRLVVTAGGTSPTAIIGATVTGIKKYI